MKKKKRTKKSIKNNRRKLIVAVLVIAAVLIAAAVGIKYVFSLGEDPDKNTGMFEDPLDPEDAGLEDEVQIDMLRELRSSGDLNTILKDWATNTGENTLMKNKDIINVLVVGLDASLGNSDVIMLASVNKAEKKICLNSIMRDSYTYMSTPAGDVTAKINAAYANGGIKSLLSTVENDYKIKIDHYISVNFQTFVEVVDLIGGVRVPVKQYEMRAMNGLAETPEEKKEKLTEYGDSVLLTGRQALLYCRIRKCDVDGDVSRTRRQRQFMSALIEQSKELSAADLPDLVKTAHKYVKTDCSVSELVSLATQALAGKWYNYEIVSTSFPLPENRIDYAGHAWVWIVDYPADAVAMQTLIYGETNIELSEDRRTAVDLVLSGEM